MSWQVVGHSKIEDTVCPFCSGHSRRPCERTCVHERPTDQRPGFNNTNFSLGAKFDPRGELKSPGMNELCIIGTLFNNLSFTPRGYHSLLFRKTEGRTVGQHTKGIT
jgi:hypothetical protein